MNRRSSLPRADAVTTDPWHLWRHLVTCAIVLAAGAGILLSRSATAQVGQGEEIIARALALQPDERNGAALYRNHCATCHGDRAWGNADTVTPALAGQLAVYSIKQLADVAEGDREIPEMHRVVAREQLIQPQALRDIAGYLAALPKNPTPQVGDGKQLALGRKYYQGMCAYCHGAHGEGNGAHATPSLQRQHYSYLVMQIRQLATSHRYSVNVDVIENLQMLPFDHRLAIADYASRLPADTSRGPVSAPPTTQRRNEKLQ
jgi:cytochrome c553